MLFFPFFYSTDIFVYKRSVLNLANLSLEAFINKILKIFERTMKCNVTNVYEISHIWELRKWNHVKNVPCSCERNVSLKKKKRKNGISLKSWIFFRLLTQLHKLTLQLRGLFFTWMKCKSLKWCPLICFSDRTKKSFDTLISDTLPTAFFYRLVMFLLVSEPKWKTKKKKKRKHKMALFMVYNSIHGSIHGSLVK